MARGPEDLDALRDLRRQVADFATLNIGTRDGLSSNADFPMDLWKALGTAGMLGIGIPKEYGGLGMGYTGINTAGRVLARYGLCLGFTLSWLMHELTARFFMSEHASSAQKQKYLPGMACGTTTASIAISEPGVGGHPKHLNTVAEKTGSGFLLRGEKTFLTNGPIADLFIVLAVTGMEDQKKLYSAFIVPGGTPGLRLSEPLDFGFLRPCPHGGIMLDNCLVRDEDLMGNPGKAYTDMAIPFRIVEDAMMMGPILGAQDARLNEIRKALREHGFSRAEDILSRLGGIRVTLSALEVIAQEVSQRLDLGNDPAAIADLNIAFRNIHAWMHAEYKALLESGSLMPSEIYRSLTHDLDHIVRFAAKVNMIKQVKVGTNLVSDDEILIAETSHSFRGRNP